MEQTCNLQVFNPEDCPQNKTMNPIHLEMTNTDAIIPSLFQKCLYEPECAPTSILSAKHHYASHSLEDDKH